MPSGRVHNSINTVSFAVLSVVGIILYATSTIKFDLQIALTFTISYFAGTFLLSPDLDLAHGHVSSKSAWGILGFLWFPYGKMMKHRGLSHTYIIGPLTRIVYLGVILAVPIILFGLPFGFKIDQTGFFVAIGGYYISQWLHLLADGIYPFGLFRKRKMRRRSRSRKDRRYSRKGGL